MPEIGRSGPAAATLSPSHLQSQAQLEREHRAHGDCAWSRTDSAGPRSCCLCWSRPA